MLSNSSIAVYFSDKIIDPSNFDEPFINTAKDLYWDTSNKLTKKIALFMRNYYIESDIGYLFED
jgi:hypothetical protein